MPIKVFLPLKVGSVALQQQGMMSMSLKFGVKNCLYCLILNKELFMKVSAVHFKQETISMNFNRGTLRN